MKSRIELRLFVSGNTETGMRAIDNLKAACSHPSVTRSHEIDIDIIHVDESPRVAEQESVMVTPTLLKKSPPPARRLVGDLSNNRDIFVTLDIEPPEEFESSADAKDA